MWWSKWHKKENRNQLVPYLSAETLVGQQAISGSEILIPVLPFRVGRESRQLSAIASTYLSSEDRRETRERPNNHLYLVEMGELRFISREHFLIDRDPDGQYYVQDRGSTLGTIVGRKTIGGQGKKGKAYMRSGDLIIPGGDRSPFVFRFQLLTEQKFSLRVVPDSPGEKRHPLNAGEGADSGR